MIVGDVREAFDASLESATHLTPMDEGAVAAARALADKIDAWDVIVEWAVGDADQEGEGVRPRVPHNDNVSLPMFLKYCDALGLTPISRLKFEKPKKEGAGGKLTQLRSVTGGKPA